jgi:hypothetical protein
MRDEIEGRIHELLLSEDPADAWLQPMIRAHRFLPLYRDTTGTFGIRPDLGLVYWDTESVSDQVASVEDPYWARIALCAGAARYPELAALVPARPAEAQACDRCAGTGQLMMLPGLDPKIADSLRCACGGLGWLLPGEPPPDA